MKRGRKRELHRRISVGASRAPGPRMGACNRQQAVLPLVGREGESFFFFFLNSK